MLATMPLFFALSQALLCQDYLERPIDFPRDVDLTVLCPFGGEAPVVDRLLSAVGA